MLSRLSNISVHAASGVTACACCHPGGDGGGGGGGGEYEVEDASSVATATSAGWREGRTMEAPVDTADARCDVKARRSRACSLPGL